MVARILMGLLLRPRRCALCRPRKEPKIRRIVYHDATNKPFDLRLDRAAKAPLAEQIRSGIATAIEEGVVQPGARLPSWHDLAARLGVARGTLRSADGTLAAGQLIEASGAAVTRVTPRPSAVARAEPPPDEGSFIRTYHDDPFEDQRWRCPSSSSSDFISPMPSHRLHPPSS